ncbi:MAG TPA: hypothetical protein VF316_08855 [Polyangiaceae bacterium]
MGIKKAPILAKIKDAKQVITLAEKDVEKVLLDVRVAPRAEKTTITKAVQDAFVKLRAAKTSLIELEKLVKAISED